MPSNNRNNNCHMRGCNRAIQNISRGLCNRCAAFQRYWSNKPVEQMRSRFSTIKFWNSRMKGELDNE